MGVLCGMGGGLAGTDGGAVRDLGGSQEGGAMREGCGSRVQR